MGEVSKAYLRFLPNYSSFPGGYLPIKEVETSTEISPSNFSTGGLALAFSIAYLIFSSLN